MKTLPILAILSALVLPAGAQLTWDADTVTSGSQDGAGSWNTSNANWWNGSANASFSAGNNVIFGSGTGAGAAGTIAVDAGGVSAGSLTFNQTGSGSYTFSGGSITGGALVKNGTMGLQFDNANTFTSIAASAGPNSQSDGAFRLGNAGALGMTPVIFTNTASMTGLHFLTGFGTATTMSNTIAFSTAAATTRLVGTAGLNLPTGQIVTLSGLLTGGGASAVIQTDNSAPAGVSRIKVTNASNSVQLLRWNLNRGGLEFTSDGSLGNAGNDIQLDVTSATTGTGLIFGASSIALNSGRTINVASQTVIDTAAFTGSVIQGQITGSANIVRRGTTPLVPANTTTNHSGGWTIAQAPAGGTSQGSLHLTAASRNGSNVFTGLGTGPITATAAGTILSAAVSGTAGNGIVLPNSATRHDFVAANGTELTLGGVISGGGASNPTFYVNTDTGGGSTGLIKLTNAANTFTGTIQMNRGGLAITSDAALGNAANPIVFDIGTATQIGLRFDASMSSARSIRLGAGKQVFDTGANTVGLSGVVSNNGASTGELFKAGTGTLTLSNANTYTGSTTVSNGTLELAGADGSLQSNSVVVNGGTLLLSGSAADRIKSGVVTSFALGGSATTASRLELGNSAITETMGELSLTAGTAVRVIDFGSPGFSQDGRLTFDSITGTSSTPLQIWNWAGTIGAGGGSDQLIISSGALAGGLTLADISFFSGSNESGPLGTAAFATGNSLELVPVPEPSGLAGTIVLLGMALSCSRREAARRRLRTDASV